MPEWTTRSKIQEVCALLGIDLKDTHAVRIDRDVVTVERRILIGDDGADD